MQYLPYNPHTKKYATPLRRHSTLGEIILWKWLKSRNLGYPFNRQKPLGDYIVDFYSKPLNLVIEIDGAYHMREAVYIKDTARQKILESLNLWFLRFTEKEVRNNLPTVLETIQHHISEYEKTHPEVKLKSQRAFKGGTNSTT